MPLHPEYTCPACNRFAGTSQECPYCGLESPGHNGFRLLRLVAISLSLTGLITLFFIGLKSPPPLLPIASIRPVMNHGLVTLTGTALPGLPDAPSTARLNSFQLTDSGGRKVAIVASPGTGSPFKTAPTPSANRSLQVTGHLYLAAGKLPRLYTQSP